jgi:hypothetical protein
MPAIADAFPALYRAMLGPALAREIPAETKATCASCAMLEGAPGAVRPIDGTPRFFRADTKCCTYHPRLPNYLVGAILSEGGAEGRRRVEERISSGVGVTPAWLHPPATWSLLYDHARGAFGRARGLRCPYYDDGACSIWAHRDAVCATWYCKYVAGEDGRRLWTVAKELVSLVEIQLSRRALLEVHPEALDGAAARPAATALSPDDIDGAPRPDHARTWGRWAGRERELYLRCHEVVRGISAAELDALLGLDGTILRRALARAADATCSSALPETLRLDPGATVQWLPDGSVALAGYSGHEAVALPGAAYPLLVRFNGEEPVATVRRRLRDELQADLSDEVLLELYRQRVLVDPRGG